MMYDNLSNRLRGEAKASDASLYIKELIIRCRDCKYRDKDNFCTGRGWPKSLVGDDGFCEKGKRKDGDGDD